MERTGFILISSILPSVQSYHCDVRSSFSRLSLVGLYPLMNSAQQNLNIHSYEQQLIMGRTNQVKKQAIYFYVPTSESAFSVPLQHAILSLFPPLCLTYWLTLPPSLLLFSLPWLVHSQDKEHRWRERAKRRRWYKVTKKKGEGVAL